jgi:DNA-binding transcriptional ArsR family regulator
MVKYSDGLDAVATALANPGRRQVVDRLQRGAATSSQLADLLGIGLPALHKHLAVLGAAELIASQKSGRVVTHRLQRDPLRRYQAWLTRRTAFWNEQLDALAEAFVAP